MFAKMNFPINLCRVLVTTILFLTVTACSPIAAPAPSGETTRVESTPESPALVAFPTTAPETATPPAAPSITSTLTSQSVPASIPIVQLVSPISNTQISISQTTYLVAFAADDNGIARVEFYDDSTLVGTENAPSSAPAVFSAVVPWTPADLGSHVLRVIAYDTTNRASAPEDMTVSVTPDTRRPTAIILYPLGTPQLELGSILQIQAAAIDEVGVTQLDLYVDNQLAGYVTAPNAAGQSPFPTVFAWPALIPGAHTLFVRAHDNQDQTNDSGPLRVQVVDTHNPAISIAFDRTNALVNDPITITITALDVSGIQRVELWINRDVASVTTSASPARQTVMTVQTTWQGSFVGDYQISARAYNANGNFRHSLLQMISILAPGQSTPTRAATATPTRTRAPRATTTPRLQPPGPPIAELQLPTDKFTTQSPLRVTFGGIGKAELDHIELWGYEVDQPTPQLICTVDARSTTQKNAQCDWSPPTAGVVSLFAQAVDSYRQSGRSPTISGYIGVPDVPTPTPTPISFAGRWTAPGYIATLRQTGAALRGEFRMTVSGKDVDGRITAGTVKSDQTSFHVDFSAPITPTQSSTLGTETPLTATLAITPTTLTVTPSPNTPFAPAMDFDCNADPAMKTLTCNWRDARGQSGSLLLKRDSSP